MIYIFFQYELLAASISCSIYTNICLDMCDPKGNRSVIQFKTLNIIVLMFITLTSDEMWLWPATTYPHSGTFLVFFFPLNYVHQIISIFVLILAFD